MSRQCDTERNPADSEELRQGKIRGENKKVLAEWTGLEPATPGVTGRYSNQLNYHSTYKMILPACQSWRPHGDSNPGYRRERAVS